MSTTPQPAADGSPGIPPDRPSAAEAERDGCYHCGLPLNPGFHDTTEVLGRCRRFCCSGCLAVARSIVDAGLEDYYAHRREKAITADVVPEILRKLDFYDHPDVQRSFIRGGESVREASLLLENIRCAACLWLNERVLRGLDGVLDVELDYNYRELEADAVVGAFSDSDSFGGGTDGKGHKVSGKYQIAKNWQFGAAFFMNDIGLEGSSKDYNRLQLDLIAKF